MKYKLNKIKGKYSFHILILLGGIIFQFFFVLLLETKEIYSRIDKNLYLGTQNLNYYVGEDFITFDLNQNSYTEEQIYEKALDLNAMAKNQGLDYFYILVQDGDDIVYALVSGDEEETNELPNAGFWFSLKESGDDSFDETWEAFSKEKPFYLESSDIWGDYRSVYLPITSKDGRKYLAGADMTITSLRKIIFFRSIKFFIPFILLLIIVIPIVYFIRNVEKDKKKMEEYINSMNMKDKLTGAYGRDHGLQLLSDYIDSYHKSGRVFSIFLVDIDNLKFINETRGIKVGDNLIKIVHRIVLTVFRKSDSVIRLEGNKLLVILPDFNRNYIKETYSLLEEKIEVFNRMNKKNLFIRLNYSMAQYSSGSLNDFLEQARLNLRIESSELNWKNKNLNEEILRGIENNEFKAYFQPKVYLKEKKVSFEALARWEDKEKGIISPGMFIPIAEKSFLINEITRIILNDSLELARILKTNISVNLSVVSFDNNEFLKELKNILMNSPYSNYIAFEITEGIAISDIQSTLIKMNYLKEAGITFSIDDFGKGYSSLPYLETLPIEEIKIDRSFVTSLDSSKVNQFIIEFVNKIADFKNFSVICEGTEEASEIEQLMLLGNFSFQGYYFGKPEPAKVVIEKYNNETYIKKMNKFI